MVVEVGFMAAAERWQCLGFMAVAEERWRVGDLRRRSSAAAA